MDYQQVFIIRVGGSGRPVEASRDDDFVVDDRELVVELVAQRESRGADSQWLQSF